MWAAAAEEPAVLPADQRLRRSADFLEVVRRGRRASRQLLTVHLLVPSDARAPSPAPARAGLVVGKAVGGSVVRSRTSRQLRHLLRPRMPDLPRGSRLVVRAAPAAVGASSVTLGAELDDALTAVRRPRSRQRSRA